VALRHRGVRTFVAVALLAILLLPALAFAQRAPAIVLKPANATLGAEFSAIRAARELADGRVLVTDTRENRFVVADLAAGTVEPVARTGSGPGEFARAATLVALAEDSTLFPDFGNARWHVMVGAKIIATLPPETPVVRLVPGIILGADRRGHILTQTNLGPAPVIGGVSVESLAVVLADRVTGHADTVARVRSQPLVRNVVSAGPGNPQRTFLSMVPLTSREQALLFTDGWVAIARLEPYRVDWRAPDGTMLGGPPLPFAPTKLDDREKRAYVEGIAKLTGRAAPDPSTTPHWPSTIDPFPINALLAIPDGRLLILRQPTAAEARTRYDVVDRRGRLAGEVTLRENEKIIAFGAKSVYIVVTDDDGIQRLRRHPWP